MAWRSRRRYFKRKTRLAGLKARRDYLREFPHLIQGYELHNIEFEIAVLEQEIALGC